MERPTSSDQQFQNVYIYGKLNYDFDDDDITFKSINVNGDATFPEKTDGEVTFIDFTTKSSSSKS